MTEKYCNKCKKIKKIDCFYKSKNVKDGYMNCCKECHKKMRDKWSDKNPDYFKNRHNSHRAENNKISRKYYRDNRSQILEKCKLDNIRNAENARNWRSKNREKCRAYDKERYSMKDKEEINKYYKNRRENDIQFRIAENLRSRFKKILKEKGIKKNKNTLDLIGCSMDDFVKHIESQFTEGMSWDNHGQYGWHLDHIKPLASFDLTLTSEQQKAMCYSNYQPLWAKDNLSKGAKLGWSPNE